MSPSQGPDDRSEGEETTDPAPSPGSGEPSAGRTAWYNRWPVRVGALVILILLVVAIVMLVGGTPGSEPESSPSADVSADVMSATDTAEPTQEALQNEIHTLGDVVTINQVWEVTLQDPTMDATEDVLAASAQNPQPASGAVFATVYVSATNTSQEPRTLYDEIGVTYIGADGEQIASADAVGPEDAYVAPTVEPGETVAGSYVFEVPAGTSEGYWLVGPADDPSGSGWKAFANAPSESAS